MYSSYTMLQLNMHGKGLTQTVNLAHVVVYAVHLLKGAQITTLPQKKKQLSPVQLLIY